MLKNPKQNSVGLHHAAINAEALRIRVFSAHDYFLGYDAKEKTLSRTMD